MSATLPESVDAWRMISARRSFEGLLSIASLTRLRGALADDAGTVRYQLDFGRDELGTGFIQVHAETSLRLVCQRSLEVFALPVAIDARLGLIRHEREEAALPPDVEPLLVADDGRVNPAEVIEDELLLALPLVPIDPDSVPRDEAVAPPGEVPEERPEDHPFAALRGLKQ